MEPVPEFIQVDFLITVGVNALEDLLSFEFGDTIVDQQENFVHLTEVQFCLLLRVVEDCPQIDPLQLDCLPQLCRDKLFFRLGYHAVSPHRLCAASAGPSGSSY